MKKYIILCLAIILCASNVSVSFADSGKDASGEYSSVDRLLEEYLSYPEFKEYYYSNCPDAINYLIRVLDRHGDTMWRGQVPDVDYDGGVPTVLIQQIGDYTCGPTSALMAIIGWGGASSVSGTTYNDKIMTLAGNMGTTYANGTGVYELANGLNLYAGSYPYTPYNFGYLTQSDFSYYVYDSLNHCRIPILHAMTNYLGYYGGVLNYHYIAAPGYSSTNSTVTLYDCHYLSNYYGIHTVSESEAYNSIHAYSRFLISY